MTITITIRATMHFASGDLVTLDVEKPAAGGRMLARHEGQVVLVWGAIPGERVRARVERAGKGVLYADTVEVLARRPTGATPARLAMRRERLRARRLRPSARS